MKYQLLFIAFLFAFIDVKSQFITSSDTVLCYGEDVTLLASGANISSSFINTDDIHSDDIDIGFNFNFYGNNYNQCDLFQMLGNYLKMRLWHLGMILIPA